ncbi:hypothetical protein MMC09_006020 [Bachmanniomyces sp. S44760]|nr:hypothetical protein [Bachmanniomyces sp. S44760]
MDIHHNGQGPDNDPIDVGKPQTSRAIDRLPWLGLGAIIGSILGTAASVAILIASNGKPIASWTFQPTVYLSIASTLTNIMISFALSQGVNIAWWRRAMRSQTQVGDLHRNWDFGNSLLAAIMSGRHFNVIALACIVTAIVPINGPLLQRASHVTTGTVISTNNIQLSLAPAVPRGFTGYSSGRSYAVSLLTSNFTPIANDYYSQAQINMTNTGCQGTCSGRVSGVGLAINCSSSTSPFDLRFLPSADGSYNNNQQSLSNGTQAFMSNFLWDLENPGNISLNVQYKDTSACFGNLNVQNCSLRSALVSYPVIIDSNKSSISLDPASTIFDDQVSNIIIPDDNLMQGPTTLGGLWLALSNKWDSTAHLRYVGAVGYELAATGSTANQYAMLDPGDESNGSNCTLRFSNPMNDLVNSARELMFRTAVGAANSSNIQHISARQVASHPIYQSEYLFLGLATAITAFAVSIVTLTFNGYWRLGRPVTMSPVETAKAFNAPIWRNKDSNAKTKALLKEVGSRSVRYLIAGGNDHHDGRRSGGSDALKEEQGRLERPAITYGQGTRRGGASRR